MAGAFGAATLTYIESQSKSQAIASALTAAGGSSFALGLDGEGLGRRNHMSVENGTGNTVKLHQYYLHWGKIKIPPSPTISHQHQDQALFHAAGGWAATGSSGIVTYQLDSCTFLHILWDCPFNFDFSDNFVALYLCDKSQKTPTGALFKKMYQDVENPGIKPKQGSDYDLVCCGPGQGTYFGGAGWTGAKTWGVQRACEVKNAKYFAAMTMGDRHATESKVEILGKDFWPEYL